jgi:hypothetical protein
MRRRTLAVAAVAGSLLIGGATGAALFGPALAGAQTTTTAPDNKSGSTFKSNEDATHEANETPEQEAAEDNGTARHGGGGHGTNEDPAHEANETPEHEAAEHAGTGSGGTAPSTAPSSGAGSASRTAFRS